jgi:hypothetical protein
VAFLRISWLVVDSLVLHCVTLLSSVCGAGLGWAAPFTAVHFVAHWLLHVCVGGWFTVVSVYKVLVGYLLL